MAKSPARRRGITLDPRADTAASLTELGSPPVAPGPDPESYSELLAELQRLRAEQETLWQRHAEQMRHELDAQRERLARQARPRMGGFGASLVMLALVASAAALGLHFWPELRVAGAEPERVSIDVRRIVPQLQGVREQVNVLTLATARMAGDVTSLRDDVSTVRADLGSVRKTVNILHDAGRVERTVKHDAERVAPKLSRNVKTVSDRYRVPYRRMPW